jgi:transcriptional regulator with XRE-family HTH domain
VLKLLDEAKSAAGVTLDQDLAAKLHVGATAVCNWRAGRAYPDPVACGHLAALTGRPLGEVLGVVGEARARSQAEKSVWRRLAQTAAHAAIVLSATLLAVGAPKPAQAATGGHYAASVYYVLRRWWRGVHKTGNPSLATC